MPTTPEKYLIQVKHKMLDLSVSDKELRRVVGWSVNTQRRRYAEPDKITQGERFKIDTYLNID